MVGQALDSGITLFDTADIYGEQGGSETLLGKALGKRRSEVVIATKFGGKMGEGAYEHGASRRWIYRAVEGEPQAPRHRLDRRLPAPLPGHRDAAGRDAPGARLPGQGRQGPLHRLQQLRRLADRRGDLDLAHPRLRRLHLGAEPVQPARPAHRARGDPGLRSTSRSGCCRTSRSRAASSPASTAAARSRPRTRAWRRWGRWRSARSPPRTSTCSRRSRPSRATAVTTILELAVSWLLANPQHLERHRRRHQAGAGDGEHRGGDSGSSRPTRCSRSIELTRRR